MQFLILNGINIPIVMNQCSRGEDKIQGVSRSFGGQLRNAGRGYRRTWEATALFQDFDIADGFINLINGEGHYWALGNGSTSDTGMSLVPGYTARGLMASVGASTDGLTFSGTGGDYWSSGCLDIQLDTPAFVILDFTDMFAWDCQLEDDKWTAMFLVLNSDTSKYDPLFFRSNGDIYLAGVKQNYDNTYTDTIKYIPVGDIGYSANVREGVLYLSIEFNVNENPIPLQYNSKISDMFIVPYVMPDYFIEQLSVGTGYTSPVVAEPSVPVTGEVTSIAYIQKPGSNNAKTVSFKLTEYLPGYKYDPDVAVPVSPFNLPVLRLGGSVLSEGEGEPTRYPVLP
ncbi:MAG: hypothetical protein HN738_02395 [Gammaproteobacteria bacterium]|jgi:hypothetical protein|nr:hypothetical protein [Gammaproteobacteria bacterium]